MSAELSEEQRQRLYRLRELVTFAPACREDIEQLLPAEVSRDEVLFRLACGDATVRGDLVGSPNQRGGSGGQFGRFVSVGGEFLKANGRRRFARRDAAFELEVETEQLRCRLGIYHPSRVWFASRGADGHLWACSVTPELPLLRERFNTRLDRRCWTSYLGALEAALELGCRCGIWLDCNPNNFGELGDRLVYVDDDLGQEAGGVSPVLQALLRLREYPQAHGDHRQEFLAGFVAATLSELRPPALVRDMLRDLDNELIWPREEALRELLRELRRQLASTRGRRRQ